MAAELSLSSERAGVNQNEGDFEAFGSEVLEFGNPLYLLPVIALIQILPIVWFTVQGNPLIAEPILGGVNPVTISVLLFVFGLMLLAYDRVEFFRTSRLEIHYAKDRPADGLVSFNLYTDWVGFP